LESAWDAFGRTAVVDSNVGKDAARGFWGDASTRSGSDNDTVGRFLLVVGVFLDFLVGKDGGASLVTSGSRSDVDAVVLLEDLSCLFHTFLVLAS
jgi:hypothetical protein